MSSKITYKDFHSFLNNSDLNRAIESVKRVDDIFELIKPNENQHSSILQWLFDPREGHGQGDAIFKDFLIAVYNANNDASQKMSFFEKWTPGRIAITGFQSLVILRELAGIGEGRQDLILVDPVNTFLLIVENKSGSRWGAAQLTRYRENTKPLLKKGKPYEGFDVAYVLLDRYKDDEVINEDQELKYWSYVDYSWLENAARRAEMRVERGFDIGQQLVISYCRRQADYESSEELKLDGLLAKLAKEHRHVVAEIGQALRRKLPQKNDLKLESIDSEIWVWTNQNRDLAKKLDQQKNLSYIKFSLLEMLKKYDAVFDLRRSVLFVMNENWIKLNHPDSKYYPISIRIREMKSKNVDEVDSVTPDAQRKYSVSMILFFDSLKDGCDTAIKSALIPHFTKDLVSQRIVSFKRFGTIKDIPENDVCEIVLKCFLLIKDVLDPIIEKSES